MELVIHAFLRANLKLTSSRVSKINLLVWFRYTGHIFFIWTLGKDKLNTFLEHLKSFDPSLKSTHELREKSLPFLDLKVKLSKGKMSADLYVNYTDRH